MSLVTIIWSMIASACLTLSAINLLAWRVQWRDAGRLLFSLAALMTAVIAFCELWMMRAESIAEWATAVRWFQLPVWLLILALVCYVRFHLRAGRPWLFWAVCATRTLALLLDFLMYPNLQFHKVTGLKHLLFLGDQISIGRGVPNPWVLVAHLSLVLFMIFVADAGISIWRRGGRRAALVQASSIVFFAVLGSVHSMLVVWQILAWPVMTGFYFMAIVAVMAFEASAEVRRTGQLSYELRESEARIALAAQAANLGLWSRDLVRDKIWATDNCRALFGFMDSEALDRDSLYRRIHPDDRPAFEQALANAVEGGGSYDQEYRVVSADGKVRWIASRGSVEFDDGGHPVLLRGVSIDISALKQAEERLRSVVEAAPNAMVMVNEEGRILLVNSQAEILFGYARNELLGQLIEILIPTGLSAPRSEHRRAYFAAPVVRSIGAGLELFGRRKDGQQLPLEIGLSPVQTPDGPFALAVIVDLTERKRSEREIAQQREELTHRARVNMLGELAGSIAHELNQPLTAILSNAQAAQRFLSHDDTDLNLLREILEDIVSEDIRAGEVIQRLRMLLGRGQVEQNPLGVNEVVADVLKVLRSDLLNRGVSVEMELAGDLPRLQGDRVQLQQVLINLVMNACDSMSNLPANDRQLMIRTGLDEGGAVSVSVSDRGVGIAPEQLERVFESFHTTKPGGMGLGLAVCRTIISAHQGELWAENNSEGGATFHFKLPATDSEAEVHYYSAAGGR